MPLDRSTIDNAFRTVLARSATDAEAAQHANDAGQAQLQAQLYGGAEYQSAVVPVAALYRMVLGRTPDPAGLNFWVNVVRDGRATMDEAAGQMLGSGEASARFSYHSDSDEQFVQALYHNALGRNVDDGGVKFWLNVLSTHAASRAAVAHAFAASPEYRGDLGTQHFVASDTGAVAGAVVDGYIAGATVFADANGNGAWDPGEAKAVTDALGHFTLENAKGTLIATGGTDSSTGLPSTVTHKAPAGSSVVNPLTTLQQAFIESGQDAHQAQQSVAALLGVELSAANLGAADPFAAALDTGASTATRAAALALQGAAAKLDMLVAVVAQVVKARAGDAVTGEAAGQAVLRALAAHSGALD
ncbi:MAG TPA: DUF4214 domain-containing protein, partial [Burkholderiaceae bacterium]|nr:DUF4214 domain-containing protein [Burkholderiaceae bacterium]